MHSSLDGRARLSPKGKEEEEEEEGGGGGDGGGGRREEDYRSQLSFVFCHHIQLIFIFLEEMGFRHIGQAGPNLLTS